MSNEKLQARKMELEEELYANNNDREGVVEQMLKPAQKSLSELQAAHTKLDGKYEEVCELLELKVGVEFQAFLDKKTEEKKAEKPVPAEEPAKPEEAK